MFLSFAILIITTLSSLQTQKAFPLLGYGATQTFVNGSTNVFAFSGLAFTFFIMPLLKEKKDFKKISYISFIITSVILFLCIVSLILSFSYLRFLNELSPIYLLVRSSNYGEFFQRPESLFVFIWILSLLAYINSIVMLMLYIAQKVLKTTSGKNLSFLFCNLIFFTALIPTSIWQVKFCQSHIYKYASIILILLFSFAILTLANIKKRRILKNEK